MKPSNEKGLFLGFIIIGILILFMILGLFSDGDKRIHGILTGIYLQTWGVLFLLSYFFSHKTFFFRGLMWLCENFSAPKGRKMAFFYFALAFFLGSFSVIEGVSSPSSKVSDELFSKKLVLYCKYNPPIKEEFSHFDSKTLDGDILLSSSFETVDSSLEQMSPFITNRKAKLTKTTVCANSGNYALDVIPTSNNILKKLLPPSFDRIKNGTVLSSSFLKQEPFNVSELQEIKLRFARFSTSNQRLKKEFNCGTSLNVYFRFDGGEWKHKMAYCGQHIQETSGWRESELSFLTKGHSSIEFLFSYESHSPKTSASVYLIDDLEVIGVH